MKKLIAKILSPFKGIARFFVVAYANHSYNKMVALADKRHDTIQNGSYGYRQFVVLLPDKAQITVIDRAAFRRYKRLLTYDNRTMTDLMKGCLYHTSDKGNNNPMSAFDKEVRKLAFIKLILQKSKL